MTTNYQLPTTNWRQRRLGFGLIEFMIVITVFGIATAVITAAFLTFERNQRLKNAAIALKNDIRLAQNKALAGDKGTRDACIQGTNNWPLIGWYVNLIEDSDSYSLTGNCQMTGNTKSIEFDIKTVDLPRGVKINTISGASVSGGVNLLFQPVVSDVVYFSYLNTPPFLESSGVLKTNNKGELIVELILRQDATKTYKVVINPSGEVSEQK